jgi:hypothetical protein
MITGIVEAGLRILEKVIPDPAAKAEAQYKLLQLAQTGELAELEAQTRLALGQIQVNQAEATNPNLFVSGWRPAVGWICAAGLGFQFLGSPLLAWISPLFNLTAPPTIALGDLLTLLVGMLGLGSLRTIEKLQGKA